LAHILALLSESKKNRIRFKEIKKERDVSLFCDANSAPRLVFLAILPDQDQRLTETPVLQPVRENKL